MWRFFLAFLQWVSVPLKGLIPDPESVLDDGVPPELTPGGSHLDPNG
jgi:hypothetical protein